MMTKNEPIYTVKKESYGKNNLKYHFVCPKCNTFLDEPTVRYKTPQCLICNTRLRWPKKTAEKDKQKNKHKLSLIRKNN